MILMYHKVDLEPVTEWWVSVDAFYRQMCDLRGYQVVALDDYEPQNPQHVVITFDGVYDGVVRHAAPILSHFGYPFELFVIGDHLGKDNSFDQHVEPPARFASEAQLRSAVAHGARIQWHSKSHRRLTGLSREEIEREVTVPAGLRDQFSERDFRWFAFPHGEHGADVVDRVRARFAGALSCVEGNDADRYQLNRITALETSRWTSSRVSIIIPNYNYGVYLREAVESVLAQTIPADEIVIADDGSTDRSRDAMEEYRDRATLIFNDKNLGIVDNFRKAVASTSGDYVALIGADNRIRSDYIERCKGALDANPDAAVAYTDVTLFGPRAELHAHQVGAQKIATSIGERWPLYLWEFPDPTPEVLERFGDVNFVHGSSMYRRSAYEEVGGYQKAGVAEDHNLFLRMHRSGHRLVHVKAAVLEYRQHSSTQANTVLGLELESRNLRARVKSLAEQVEEQRSHGARVTQELEALRSQQANEHDLFVIERDRMVKEIDLLVGELARKAAQANDLHGMFEDRQRKLMELSDWAQGLSTELRNMKASLSWKVTVPLRYVEDSLARVRHRIAK